MTALISSIAGVAGNALASLTRSAGAGGADPNTAAGEAATKGFAATLAAALSPAARQAAGQDQRTDEPAPAKGSEDATETEAEVPLPLLALGAPAPAATTPAAEGETAAGATAALNAEVDALIAEAGGKPADAGRVYRGTDKLDGEFRERFERVVSRMSEEYGHKVEIVETHREQARQEALYQQGRSRPGPVVTWTRQSNHTEGRAADVLIDGSYSNAKGYARLAEIAAEEGLNTLGARDPGHVELAGPRTHQAGPPRPEQAPLPGQMARVAQVAQVARVASVAQVAQVARVARPGTVLRASGAEGTEPSGTAAIPAPPGELHVPVEVAGAAAAGKANGEAAARVSEKPDATMVGDKRAAREEEKRAAESAARGGAGEGGQSSDPQTGSGTASAQRANPSTQRAEAVAPTGIDITGRIARALELQENRASQPLTHMLLRVENPGGTEDRIRVDLRGGSVGATLDIGNASDASRLSARVEELTRALGQHGLEAESVRIRATPAAEHSEMLRAAAALGDSDILRVASSRAGSESSFSRDRGEPQRESQQRQDRSEDPRNRSRKEHKGGKDQ